MTYTCNPNPPTAAESFFELAPLVLSILQMGFYLSAVDKYKDRLEDYAEYLHDCADRMKEKYVSLRDCDPDFYAYYKSLPDYNICETNIQRSKGAAFFGYGSRLRQSLSTVRGYTPLAKVHLNNLVSSQAVSQSAITRVDTLIRERNRQDEHTLERWAAIIGAPVGVESHSPAASKVIIGESFKSLKAFSQGFNSAGALFGRSLFGVLT